MREVIPVSVAQHLTSVDNIDSIISKSDISVVFHDFGQFDVRECPLEIFVYANHFLNRAANVDERAKLIARDLHECVAGLPCHNFFVYVLLGTGGFFKANYTEEPL